MKKSLKTLVLILAASITIVVSGWYVFLYILGGAFGSECDIKNEWRINDYRIVEQRCVGWAGPHYYPIYLFKDKKELARHGIRNDSCFFIFKTMAGDSLIFNTCNASMEIINPIVP